jgi:hypothetical protein
MSAATGIKSPWINDLERLVKKGAIFASLSDDEQDQAIHEIDSFMERMFIVGIATWDASQREVSQEKRDMNSIAIALKAVKFAEELTAH